MEQGFYDFLSVASGAIIGATCRYYFLLYFKSIKPWSTFIINIFGTFTLGIMSGSVSAASGTNSTIDPKVALFVGTGFCGSLTTFSTFAYDALVLIKTNNILLAFVYLFSSVLAGLLIVTFGFYLGDRFITSWWRNSDDS